MAENVKNAFGNAGNATKDLVNGVVQSPMTLAKKGGEMGEKAVHGTSDGVSDGVDSVMSPFENFMDQVTSCFGMLK
jgi:hypothetical protein